MEPNHTCFKPVVGGYISKKLTQTQINNKKKMSFKQFTNWRITFQQVSTSILNIQMHLLIHLVDEVQLAITIHAIWMLILKRFMKTLKRFVGQKIGTKRFNGNELVSARVICVCF